MAKAKEPKSDDISVDCGYLAQAFGTSRKLSFDITANKNANNYKKAELKGIFKDYQGKYETIHSKFKSVVNDSSVFSTIRSATAKIMAALGEKDWFDEIDSSKIDTSDTFGDWSHDSSDYVDNIFENDYGEAVVYFGDGSVVEYDRKGRITGIYNSDGSFVQYDPSKGRATQIRNADGSGMSISSDGSRINYGPGGMAACSVELIDGNTFETGTTIPGAASGSSSAVRDSQGEILYIGSPEDE